MEMQSNSDKQSREEKEPREPKSSQLQTRIFRQVVRKRTENNKRSLYIIEVHEDDDANDKETYWVNVRHIDKKTATAFPMSMCQALIDQLINCQVKEENTESKDKKFITSYNVSLLKNHQLTSNDSSYGVRISDASDLDPEMQKVTKYLVCGPVNELDGNPNAAGDASSGSNQDEVNAIPQWKRCGQVDLTNLVMSRILSILNGIAIRYKKMPKVPEARSLYSNSGGRRFFFDIRTTRWGKRMHISQVTDLHRNVVAVPLENLVSFRDRLDYFIKALSLEETQKAVDPAKAIPEGLKRKQYIHRLNRPKPRKPQKLAPRGKLANEKLMLNVPREVVTVEP